EAPEALGLLGANSPKAPGRQFLVPASRLPGVGALADQPAAASGTLAGDCPLHGESELVQHDTGWSGPDARPRIKAGFSNDDLSRLANAVLGIQTRSTQLPAAPLRALPESLHRQIKRARLL